MFIQMILLGASYCTLSTNFAVSVYGVPFSLEFQLGIIGAVVFGLLIILFMSYFAHPSFRNKEKLA